MTAGLMAAPRAATATRARGLGSWWAAAAVLPLLVLSDWKWRIRASDAAISGSADWVVALEVLVYGAVAVWLAARFRWSPWGGRVNGLWVLAWSFAAATAVAALWSPFPTLGIVRGAQLVVIAAVGQSLASHATRSELHRMAHAFLVLCVLGVGLGVALDPASQQGAAVSRFTWLALHPVLSAVYLCLGLVLATAYALTPSLRAQGPRWPVQAYPIVVAGLAVALVDNRTRGALAGAVLGATLLVFERVRNRDAPAVLAGIVLLCLLAASMAGSALWTYVERGEGASNLRTLNYRTELWSKAVEAWQAEPLTGLGTGATRGVFLEVTGLGGGHNAFINVLVDTGLLGAVLWVGLVIALGRALFTLPRQSDRPVLIGLYVGLVVMSLTNDGLGASANVSMVFLFVLLGWVGVLRRTRAGTAYEVRA